MPALRNRAIGSVSSAWRLRFILLRGEAAARDKSSAIISAVTIFMSLARRHPAALFCAEAGAAPPSAPPCAAFLARYSPAVNHQTVLRRCGSGVLEDNRRAA